MAKEHFLLVIAVADAAELIAHALFHHHGPRHARRLLDIARGAGRDVLRPKDQQFRLAAAEDRSEIRQAPLFRVAQRVPLGQAQVRPSARPRGMIVTLCKGSWLGIFIPTIACPASW